MKTLTFKRHGDYYKTFGDSAKIVSEALGLVLTSQEVNGKRIP